MPDPLADRSRYDLPWLPAEAIVADRLLPEEGSFRWCNHRFHIRPFPGQTWWHCAFDTDIDGRHVLFSGDNFQPPNPLERHRRLLRLQRQPLLRLRPFRPDGAGHGTRSHL